MVAAMFVDALGGRALLANQSSKLHDLSFIHLYAVPYRSITIP